MKIMLPVRNGLSGKHELAKDFHNIEFVCIYDNHSEAREWITAREISEFSGGLNTGLIEKEVYSIISINITPMVLSMFKRTGIKVFKAQGYDVSKNIHLFQNNELKLFTMEESQLNQACNSNSCSSCGSTCN